MRTIILLTAFLLLSLSTAISQNAYYKVTFPDDTTYTGCGVMPDTIYPTIMQYPGCPFNVGVSVKDQVFNITSTGGCKKILRTWTLIYWCDYDPNEPWPTFIPNPPDTDDGPMVFGIPDNRGHLQYTQIIKVVDTEAPIFIDCPTGPLEFCDFTTNDPAQYNNGWADLCEGPVDLGVKVIDACSQADIKVSYRLFLDLDGNGSMETYISSSSPNAWPIDKMVVGGDTVMVSIDFPPGFGLPYGKHKIEWIANDNCGNETLCKYEFTVKDCKAPTVVCINGLSINIMQTGMITLWDTDFIKDKFDNCTPTNQLKIGIRKSGTGTGFPVDTHSVTFDCSELGPQYVEVWAEDAYGNADYCETYVIVQDNMGSCPPSSPFKGTVATDDQTPVSGVQMTLKKGNVTKGTFTTDDKGQFQITAQQAGCNYKLIPAFTNDTPKTGINTLDALLVGGHIDGIQLLNSPYKMLAADVNGSGGLDADDIQAIINVILGVQDNFPAKPAWQFILSGYQFPNPDKPWTASAVPASTPFFCLSGAMQAPMADFTAVKTGDVNSSASGNFHKPQTDDRQKSESLVFTTPNQVFKSGTDVRVEITTPDLAGLTGFQYTLDFDPAVLSLITVEPALIPAEHTAAPGAGHLTSSWYSTIMLDPTIVGKNIRVRAYTLVFRALQSGALNKVLGMSSSVTPAEAYNRQLQPVDVRLSFLEDAPNPKGSLQLLPASPNPAQDRVMATYFLPEAGQTTLTLTDARGTTVQSIQAHREAGYHTTPVEFPALTAPGLLFLRLEGPGGVAVQRVLKL